MSNHTFHILNPSINILQFDLLHFIINGNDGYLNTTNEPIFKIARIQKWVVGFDLGFVLVRWYPHSHAPKLADKTNV